MIIEEDETKTLFHNNEENFFRPVNNSIGLKIRPVNPSVELFLCLFFLLSEIPCLYFRFIRLY